jgi:osmotically-inducible protein OsmY
MTTIDDDGLQRSVLDELKWESSVNAASIGVIAKHGIVTLTGNVASYAEKVAAERAALRVDGVRGLAQEIEVILPSEHRRTDEDIAAAALRSLEWDVSVPNDRVQVEVEKGWIILRGEVDRQYQKMAAEHAAHRLVGVTGVTNALTIRQAPGSADMQKQIEEALKRDAELRRSNIVPVVEGEKVVLIGRARSWYERERAEQTAWSAPGVAVVDNRVVIEG